MFNSSAFSIMNRKHKTVVNKYTKNCNKNYSRPMLQPVKEENEQKRRKECRGEKKRTLSRVPATSLSLPDLLPLPECPPQDYPISVFLVPTLLEHFFSFQFLSLLHVLPNPPITT